MPQAVAVAFGTYGFAPVTGKHHAVLHLVLVLLDHAEEPVDPFEAFGAMPQYILFFLRQVAVGAVYGKAGLGGHVYKCLFPFPHFFPAPACHGVIIDRKGGVGYDQPFVDTDAAAEAFATGTCPERVVEIEKQVGWLHECYAVGFEAG